jgi:short-subunit dehydrogenase
MPTVLITGVSDGIGHALAVAYAARGAACWRCPASVSGIAGGHVRPDDYCVADLGDSDAAATVQHFLTTRSIGALDILVHNAASGWYGPAPQQSAASIEELLRVNLYAPISLTHALLPRLRPSHGVVAFISSVHSALPTPDFAVYTATKAALDGFARNLRLEERGAVDVVVLWPGPTRTQNARQQWDSARAHPVRALCCTRTDRRAGGRRDRPARVPQHEPGQPGAALAGRPF